MFRDMCSVPACRSPGGILCFISFTFNRIVCAFRIGASQQHIVQRYLWNCLDTYTRIDLAMIRDTVSRDFPKPKHRWIDTRMQLVASLTNNFASSKYLRQVLRTYRGYSIVEGPKHLPGKSAKRRRGPLRHMLLRCLCFPLQRMTRSVHRTKR